jgi:hypothetical protein
VDDDKKTVDLIRLSLEKEQFEALVAYEGIEALGGVMLISLFML